MVGKGASAVVLTSDADYRLRQTVLVAGNALAADCSERRESRCGRIVRGHRALGVRREVRARHIREASNTSPRNSRIIFLARSLRP
jgi:hypothetical protein